MTPTPEQIAQWAREANRYASHQTNDTAEWGIHRDEHLVALACAWRAEQDAKLCAEQYHKHIGPEYGEVRYGIAACETAIRASVKGNTCQN